MGAVLASGKVPDNNYGAAGVALIGKGIAFCVCVSICTLIGTTCGAAVGTVINLL